MGFLHITSWRDRLYTDINKRKICGFLHITSRGYQQNGGNDFLDLWGQLNAKKQLCNGAYLPTAYKFC
jgi:hypothetical protein